MAIVALLFVFLFSATASQAANFVTIKAFATEEYLKERASNKDKKIQTYQFMKGRHFKGKSRDKGVEEISFNDLVGVKTNRYNYFAVRINLFDIAYYFRKYSRAF